MSDNFDVNEVTELLYDINPDRDIWGAQEYSFIQASRSVTANAQIARVQAERLEEFLHDTNKSILTDLSLNNVAEFLYNTNPDRDIWGTQEYDFKEALRLFTAKAQVARKQAEAVFSLFDEKAAEEEAVTKLHFDVNKVAEALYTSNPDRNVHGEQAYAYDRAQRLGTVHAKEAEDKAVLLEEYLRDSSTSVEELTVGKAAELFYNFHVRHAFWGDKVYSFDDVSAFFKSKSELAGVQAAVVIELFEENVNSDDTSTTDYEEETELELDFDKLVELLYNITPDRTIQGDQAYDYERAWRLSTSKARAAFSVARFVEEYLSRSGNPILDVTADDLTAVLYHFHIHIKKNKTYELEDFSSFSNKKEQEAYVQGRSIAQLIKNEAAGLDPQTDYAVSPAEYLAEYLEDTGKTVEDLAYEAQDHLFYLEAVLANMVAIDTELADKLGAVTDIPAYVWLRYEQAYQDDLARIAAKKGSRY